MKKWYAYNCIFNVKLLNYSIKVTLELKKKALNYKKNRTLS